MMHRLPRRIVCFLLLLCLIPVARGDTTSKPLSDIPFTREVLDNGLTVLYIPLHTSPVIHVRVIYHVGSRDERPDRQGFAHMFEHMMFRGSAHVAPQEHMKMIGVVGGNSNAFTAYDQTAYVNTIPANQLQMALYLEADRMSSFKVSDDIFKVERVVVSEEWRMRYANTPYGTMFEDFVKTAYTKSPYRWTTIGNMDQLKAAASSELQQFFNKYYVPNNACLVISGDFDQEKAKEWVHQYYGWIPKGADIQRNIPDEPEQTEARQLTAYKTNIQLPSIYIGYKTADYTSDDHYALSVLGSILGEGETSRLDKRLVNSDDPMCVNVGGGDEQLQDVGFFLANARVLPGKDTEAVRKAMMEEIQKIADNGVTDEELEKVKTSVWVGLIHARETCTSLAALVGEEQVFGGDANRANEAWPKIQKLTAADIQAIAKKYCKPEASTTVIYLPDPTGKHQRELANANAKATEVKTAGVAPSTQPIEPRVSADQFPKDYPTKPPFNNSPIKVTFEKGTETDVNGVKVIVMPDHRLPLVNWQLIMRSGGDAEPKDKIGLAGITASMLRRGAGDLDYMALSQDLEERGISIEAMDGGDSTRIVGSCTTDQLDHAIGRTRDILLQPKFPAGEFAKLKNKSIGGLIGALANPNTVAPRDLNQAVFGDSPMGRMDTPPSLAGITLDDVKKWYETVYKPNDAILTISGDVDVKQGREIAAKLLDGWKPAESLPTADYAMPPKIAKRHIILVDNPAGKQSTIRMAVRTYDIHTDEKFPGSVASRILSDGIESRLNLYVRAEKGYTYGCYGTFQPTRHAGTFNVTVDTNPDTTQPCIEAVFKVLKDMRQENVTDKELAEAKTRVAGGMVMSSQTMSQQAGMRVDGILNGYPIDYYDKYPERVAQVNPDQVRDVMDKYVLDDRFTIVVVAPAAQVKEQLEKLVDSATDLEVRPMPMQRPDMQVSNQPDSELLMKKAG
jgi:zinc protease